MTAISSKAVRCAIYTRVSTDSGLDQEFNSLDAQFEASTAYIKSQAHASWKQLRSRYDDGGFSGGSTDRPALQQLLTDVRANRIDVIVVYKVDRLTRSLADFAKLVELFDKHGVSFVSVTQQFNTTTSMGRLTLNVLLSFAQFEREVTSERIRDKMAASKRKGLWVGGVVPLGYRLKDHKIEVDEAEANTVRHIFKRYLELGTHRLLISDLRNSGVTTRVRKLSTGKTIGGIPFTVGPIAHVLRNRFYVGEIDYKGEILKGEHLSIIDHKTFAAVQALRSQQRTNLQTTREQSKGELRGLIYDDRGNRMTPVAAKKRGKTYRYYISSPLQQGRTEDAGSVSRISADQVEELVARTIETRETLERRISRIKVGVKAIEIEFQPETSDGADASPDLVVVPWTKRPAKVPREIVPPMVSDNKPRRPIPSKNRLRLVVAISRGRLWLRQLRDGQVTAIEQIAVREKCSVRQVNRLITLAFLCPRLVEAAVAGRLPKGVGVASVRELPSVWKAQHDSLGLKFDSVRRGAMDTAQGKLLR